MQALSLGTVDIIRLRGVLTSNAWCNQEINPGLEAKVVWNGVEAASLPILPIVNEGSTSIILPSVHQGHHSVFAHVLCDESCGQPVNGSVFFSGSAAVSEESHFPAQDAGSRALLDEDVRSAECTSNDQIAFACPSLSGGASAMDLHQRQKCKHPPLSELCNAVTALHSKLVADVDQV